MNLRAKLIAGSTAVILFTVFQGMIAVDRIEQTGRLAGDLYDGPLMAINFARSAKTNFLQLDRQMMVAAGQPKLLASDEVGETLEDLHSGFREDLQVVLERSKDERIARNLNAVGAMADEWWRLSQLAIAAVKGGEGTVSTDELHEVVETVNEKLDQVIEYASENGYNFNLSAKQAVEETHRFIILVMLGTVVIGLLIAMVQGRMISRPITRMTRRMAALADGDYSLEIDYLERRDEIGEMARAVQVFRDNGKEKQQLEEVVWLGFPPLRRGSFFKIINHILVLRMMARACR
ncbi:MAG: HAMP domain-containing protein, partial [Proteobacteria bacterium]|nr:HAMP domain-containing protein [Pseudomonadota bacterium]